MAETIKQCKKGKKKVEELKVVETETSVLENEIQPAILEEEVKGLTLKEALHAIKCNKNK